MPKFPRFTSGSFGRLDFATMNDLFDRVEQLEAQLAMTGGKIRRSDTEIVVAEPVQFVSINGNIQTWRWKEVILNKSLNSVADAERSTTGPNGADEYPLIGRNLSAGLPVLAKACYDDNGMLFYRQIEEFSGDYPVVKMGKITSSTVSGSSPIKWVYNLEEVEILQTGDWATTGVSFAARNGCENVSDPNPPNTGPYGVGAIIPAGVTVMQRQAIRIGVIVMCLRQPSGEYAFSIPNGYRVVC